MRCGTVTRANNRPSNRWEYFRSRIILHLQILEREYVLDAASAKKIRDVLDDVYDQSRHLRLEKIMRSDLQTGRTLKAK